MTYLRNPTSYTVQHNWSIGIRLKPRVQFVLLVYREAILCVAEELPLDCDAKAQ